MAVPREVVWHEEIAVPGKWIEFVDENVLASKYWNLFFAVLSFGA